MKHGTNLAGRDFVLDGWTAVAKKTPTERPAQKVGRSAGEGGE